MPKKIKENWFYKLLLSASGIIEWVFKDKKKLAISIVLGILFIFFLRQFRGMFIIAFLIGLGAISMIYVRYFHYAHYLGFELCMMATVLATIRFGVPIGAFVGFASITGALILSGYFKPTYFVSVLSLPLIAFIVPLISHLPLWQVGLIVTFIYDAVVLPLYILLGSRIISSTVFFVTHMMLNYWVFKEIAPLLLRIIS